jgi:hypothetical protein
MGKQKQRKKHLTFVWMLHILELAKKDEITVVVLEGKIVPLFKSRAPEPLTIQRKSV